jgi:hypothetical protein
MFFMLFDAFLIADVENIAFTLTKITQGTWLEPFCLKCGF